MTNGCFNFSNTVEFKFLGNFAVIELQKYFHGEIIFGVASSQWNSYFN